MNEYQKTSCRQWKQNPKIKYGRRPVGSDKNRVFLAFTAVTSLRGTSDIYIDHLPADDFEDYCRLPFCIVRFHEYRQSFSRRQILILAIKIYPYNAIFPLKT